MAASQPGGRRAGGGPPGLAGCGQQSRCPAGASRAAGNQTARAIAAMTTTTRATCHAGELSSPASTAKASPPEATTADNTAGTVGLRA